MKKCLFILLLTIVSISVYSQRGDLAVGIKGGYITSYKDILYGADIAYHIADPLEIAFTGLLNTNMTLEDEFDSSIKDKLSMYSFNLDARYYLLLQRTWGTGPALGAQYFTVKNKTQDFIDNVWGFNIGWHIRGNITESLRLNGGWRYTNASEDFRYHYIYAGITYTFSLY